MSTTLSANMKTVIFDIDRTLSDNSHRVHLIKEEGFDSFYEACDLDKPIYDMIDLCTFLNQYYRVVIITGRPKKTAKKTIRWLKRFNIQYDAIYFREDGDFRPDYVIKEEILHQLDEPIWFAVDDNAPVVDMFRRNGITCLQCADSIY